MVDATAPTALITPTDGSTVNYALGQVNITFSEAVFGDATGNSIATADWANYITITDVSGNTVSGTYTYNANTNKVVFKPTTGTAITPNDFDDLFDGSFRNTKYSVSYSNGAFLLTFSSALELCVSVSDKMNKSGN